MTHRHTTLSLLTSPGPSLAKVRRLPPHLRKILGDLSGVDRLLVGLNGRPLRRVRT